MDNNEASGNPQPGQRPGSPFGEIPTDAELNELQQGQTKVMSTFSIIGLVAGIVPFFLSFHSSTSQSINGEVLHSTYVDYVAVPGGALALLMGVVALVDGLRNQAAGKGIRAGIAVAIAGLGIFQLLRGFGVV